ncbi:MAG: SdrD B-like domain-containing protein [Saprospiraceae bacterium]
MITLTPDMEPTVEDNTAEATGAAQDDAAEANGDMTVDFGFVPMMELGSTVFYDVDNDGVQDLDNPLESGISGVTVNLYDDLGNFITSVMTDAEGNYLFEMLAPGDYQVGVIATLGAPVASSGAGVSTDPNDDVDGNSDGDATAVAGDESLSGIVTLTPGTEPDNETYPGGVQDDDNEANGNMTVDFGFVPNMSIGSTVYYDANNNGDHDDNGLEPGIEGVTVELLYDVNGDGTIDPSEVIATTVTDADGNYYFGDLPPGDYMVAVTPSTEAGASSMTAVTTDDNGGDGLNNGTQPGGVGTTAYSPVITLTPDMEPTVEDNTAEATGAAQDDAAEANGDMTVDFGFVPMMELGSTVFYDVDNDGVQDLDNPLESGISGVTVNLYDDLGNFITSVMTDAEGNYLFEMLASGDYQVGVIRDLSAPVASSGAGVSTDPNDDVDGNSDGDATAVAGDESLSGIVTLTSGTEPDNETYPGGVQDDDNEANGNDDS